MDANTKTLLKVTGGFLLKIVAYTACVTAIHFIINDGAEYPKSQKTVLLFPALLRLLQRIPVAGTQTKATQN